MVELDLGQCGTGMAAGEDTGEDVKAEKSEQAKERSTRRNFNKHVLWCRLSMDPELELPRMQDTLERVVAKAKAAMLANIEDDPEWERHTKINAHDALQLLNDALAPVCVRIVPLLYCTLPSLTFSAIVFC